MMHSTALQMLTDHDFRHEPTTDEGHWRFALLSATISPTDIQTQAFHQVLIWI